jgi:two-component system, OmpR family, alkaline phosphatase synthesis response regulator PhoP
MTTHKARSRPQLSAPPPGGGRGRLLVVEDEKDLRELLQYNLTREGFHVATTERGEQALKLVQDEPPDLILLDLMLPGMDGLELCRALKADAKTAGIPIVIVTAKGEETDIVIGLEMGADDYITKPISPRVLMARVKAVLRRPAPEGDAEDGAPPPLRFERLAIFPDRHEVRIDDRPVELTATEFRLLHLMARRPGRVFTRQQIIDRLHDGFAAVTDRSVDVQVVTLRRKLGPLAEMLQTVRGVGYRFREEPTE